MPAGNPLISPGRSYAQASAAAGGSGQGIKSAEIMPVQLAVMLIAAAAGLYGLKALGFRFVVEVGTSGGK